MIRVRFFTVTDYEDEEQWLRKQHKKGWKFTKFILPCFYYFEKCEPEDVIYRLDFSNEQNVPQDYLQIFQDYGWEYFFNVMGWNYFKKSAELVNSEKDAEIFSDGKSKLDMLTKVQKARIFPLIIIFCGCVIPNLFNASFNDSVVLRVLFSILAILYIWLFIHCGIKIKKLKKKYSEK